MTQKIRIWLETPFAARPLWTWVLMPIAFLLSLILCVATSFRRRFLFTSKRAKHSFPFPIICIGNIAMGGTGKSPLVRFLAKVFFKKRI